MKNLLVSFALICFTATTFGQTLYVPTGTSGIGTSTNSNVGIGTTTPNYKLELSYNSSRFIGINPQNQLDVEGNSQFIIKEFVPGIELNDASTSASSALIFTNNNKFYIGKKTGLAIANSDLFNIDLNNGNIGIGLAAPNMPLHIYGSADGSNVNLLKLQNGAGQTAGSEVGIYFAPTNATTGRGAKITGYQAGNNQIGLKFYVGAASDAATEAMYINSSGNIGIGTSNPSVPLEIAHIGNKTSALWLNDEVNPASTTGIYLRSTTEGRISTAGILTIYTGGDLGTERIRLKSNGNVGIGTTDPADRLQIESTGYDDIFSIRRNASPQTNTFDFRITSTPKGILALNDGSLTIMPTEKDADIAFLTKDVTLASATPQFIIKKDGKVLIGKTAPNAGTDYLLDVAGKVRANEIVVNTDGADFVFEKDYKLRNLAELEQFVKTNKHLPDIAPATDMQQNGVSVSELQTKLLQKVEELTLYTIEQNKKMEQQNSKIESIEQQNKLLKEEIELLKQSR